jgi:hypothetical protein
MARILLARPICLLALPPTAVNLTAFLKHAIHRQGEPLMEPAGKSNGKLVTAQLRKLRKLFAHEQKELQILQFL